MSFKPEFRNLRAHRDWNLFLLRNNAPVVNDDILWAVGGLSAGINWGKYNDSSSDTFVLGSRVSGNLRIYKSFDFGVTWSFDEFGSGGGFAGSYGTAYGNNTFCVLNGNKVAVSVDNGVTFEERPQGSGAGAPFSFDLVHTYHAANNKWYFCDVFLIPSFIMTSDDLILYTKVKTDCNRLLQNRLVLSCGANVVTIGQRGATYSVDGANFLVSTIPAQWSSALGTHTSAAFGNNTIIVVGGDNDSRFIYKSVDYGVTFTRHQVLPFGTYRSVRFFNNQFIAIQRDAVEDGARTLYISKDNGETWEATVDPYRLPFGHVADSMSAVQDKYVAYSSASVISLGTLV